jgi:hypothetical protein
LERKISFVKRGIIHGKYKALRTHDGVHRKADLMDLIAKTNLIDVPRVGKVAREEILRFLERDFYDENYASNEADFTPIFAVLHELQIEKLLTIEFSANERKIFEIRPRFRPRF